MLMLIEFLMNTNTSSSKIEDTNTNDSKQNMSVRGNQTDLVKSTLSSKKKVASSLKSSVDDLQTSSSKNEDVIPSSKNEQNVDVLKRIFHYKLKLKDLYRLVKIQQKNYKKQ